MYSTTISHLTSLIPPTINYSNLTVRTIVIIFSNTIIAGPAYSKITVKTSTGRLMSISKRIIGNRIYIKPVSRWRAHTRYIITVPRTAVKTSTGNMMAADFRSGFTTV
ncbi:Ig-like domain-containing protein [Methanothermobacter sp.]|uniref:Ig-like domain-containing protein n=1 Tax=Methanothermobacter sp. TaxID=1884223 RepID=UPI003C77DE08